LEIFRSALQDADWSICASTTIRNKKGKFIMKPIGKSLLRVPVIATTALAFAALGACGGGGNSGSGGGVAPTYSIPVAVSGLDAGLSVTLQDNGGDNLTVSSNMSTQFATKVASGGAYAVTVSTQPTGQNCTVASGSGSASANITPVPAVTCANVAPTSFNIPVSVSGLGAGLSVTLQDNGGDNLTVTSNMSSQFATKVAGGGAYAVTVSTQPTGQNCTVANGTGTASANITPVPAVTCANTVAQLDSIGGFVAGLASGQSVVLTNNGGDNYKASANGTFAFATQIASGGAYSVLVLTQPTGQTCTVTHGAGSLAGANITNVWVVCTYSAPTVSGTYNYVSFDGTPGAAETDLANVTFSGGSVSGTATQNVNGTQIFSNAAIGGSFASGAGGQISITASYSTAGAVLGFDGEGFVTLDQGSLDSPVIIIGVKAATSGVTTATIAGSYGGIGMELGAGTHANSDLSMLTVDTSGNATIADQSNNSGTVSSASLTSSFAVTGTGALTGSGGDTIGAISADKDLVVLMHVNVTAATTSPGWEPPYFFAAVRLGTTGLSAATLSGQYTSVNYLNGSGNASSTIITTVFDGNGNLYAIGGTNNTAGTITTGLTGSGTYTVSSSGALTITTGGITLTGYVSADGNAFTLADMNNGDTPTVAIGMRQ
jgi:hypothetical protein